jgi:asparagine synthase (glutamine-hydrolysing)
MGDAIAHRGPDGEGYWAESGVGLVHRRLAIIDPAGGAQPVANEDGSIVLVCNGEVYNFPELRAGLEARGHRFRTRSDVEVLVHLYEEEGDALVRRLRGMFAFALWDRPRRRLLLGRDRLGIKPLHVCRGADQIVFGSELKAVLAHPGVRRDLDHAALEEYLAFGMVCGPASIFRGVEKLPPAHVLAVTAGSLNAPARRYWQLCLEPDERPTAQEWQERIRDKVAEAVRVHLLADVPVGAFLSGGVDSSVVVAEAVGEADGPLQTFSVGFRAESLSELPYARQVSDRFETRHVEEVVTPDAAALVDRLVHHFDEPFADSSAVPTFLVARLATRSVKVVLSGDGGDEAFGGYARYAHDLREAALRRRLPGWLRRRALGPLARRWPKADWLPRPLRARTLLTNLSLEPAAAYANTLSLCREPLRRRLLAPDVAVALNGHRPEDRLIAAHAAAPNNDVLGGMIAADLGVLLPDDFLVKVDRASMAHGLEVRPPLLDHELLELAARIPSRFKVRGGRTKWVFKEAYRGRLPAAVLDRPKQGFEVPLDAWLRGPLRPMFEATLFDPGARVGDLVDRATARAVWHDHLCGRGRHGGVLWSLLVLALWAEHYLGASPLSPVTELT